MYRNIITLPMAAVAAATLLAGCSGSGTPMANPLATTTPDTTTFRTTTPAQAEDDDSLDIETSYFPEPTPTSTAEPTIPPAPANAMTMTCTEFESLDEATKVAVVTVHGVNKNPTIAATLIGIFCQRQGSGTVAEAISMIKPEFLYK